MSSQRAFRCGLKLDHGRKQPREDDRHRRTWCGNASSWGNRARRRSHLSRSTNQDSDRGQQQKVCRRREKARRSAPAALYSSSIVDSRGQTEAAVGMRSDDRSFIQFVISIPLLFSRLSQPARRFEQQAREDNAGEPHNAFQSKPTALMTGAARVEARDLKTGVAIYRQRTARRRARARRRSRSSALAGVCLAQLFFRGFALLAHDEIARPQDVVFLSER
jgi:hypothetical protein